MGVRDGRSGAAEPRGLDQDQRAARRPCDGADPPAARRLARRTVDVDRAAGRQGARRRQARGAAGSTMKLGPLAPVICLVLAMPALAQPAPAGWRDYDYPDAGFLI